MTDPRPRGAVAVITNGRGEYLMHLRDDIPGIFWPGYWSLLGGGCEPGESPTEAIARELMEEVGLALPGLTELCEVPDTPGSGQLVTAFAAFWDGDAASLTLTEGQRLDWVPPAGLDSLRIPGFARYALDRHRGAAR